MRTHASLKWAVLFLGFLGCSQNSAKPYPLKGTITIKDEGPLTRGMLELSNGRFSAHAPIQKNGEFEILGEGVPVGTYKAMLLNTSTGPTYENPDQKVVRVIDEKYETGETTTLTINVEPKANIVNLVVGPVSTE